MCHYCVNADSPAPELLGISSTMADDQEEKSLSLCCHEHTAAETVLLWKICRHGNPNVIWWVRQTERAQQRQRQAGSSSFMWLVFCFFLKATIHLTKTFCQTEGYKKVVTCPENGGIKTPDKNYNRIRFRSKVYDWFSLLTQPHISL